jgi:4-amino-4-deoxy-L-arabinose transferase-like glycosyltransferase
MEFNGRQEWGFPPVVPLVIAGCRLLAGPRLWPVNLVMTLFGLGVIALAALAIRRLASDLPERPAGGAAVGLRPGAAGLRPDEAGAAVLVAASAQLFNASTRVLTDVPFTFLVVLGVYGFARARQGHWSWLLAGSLAMAAATWTRLPGVVLWGGLALGTLVDARPPGYLKRFLATAAGGALVLGALAAWMIFLRSRADPGTLDYVRAARQLDYDFLSWAKWASVGQALLNLPRAVSGVLMDQELPGLNLAPTALVLVGLWTLARGRQWIVIMPIVLYIAFLASLGPSAVAERYFLPILPLVAYALVAGVRTVAAWGTAARAAWRKRRGDEAAGPTRRAWAVPLAVGLCVAVSLPKIGRTIYWMRHGDFYQRFDHGKWADAVALGRALGERGRPGTDRVVAPWFTIVHYLSRLETTSVYSADEPRADRYTQAPPGDLARAAVAGGYRFVVVPAGAGEWSQAAAAGLEETGQFRDPPERFGRLLLFERAAVSGNLPGDAALRSTRPPPAPPEVARASSP